MPEPKRTTIKLQYPILDGTDAISEIVLRDPNYDDYMTFDEPFVFSKDSSGELISTTHGPTVALYVARCLVQPKNHMLLKQCSIQDGMRIRGWLNRFFSGDAPASPESTTSPIPSSTATAA